MSLLQESLPIRHLAATAQRISRYFRGSQFSGLDRTATALRCTALKSSSTWMPAWLRVAMSEVITSATPMLARVLQRWAFLPRQPPARPDCARPVRGRHRRRRAGPGARAPGDRRQRQPRHHQHIVRQAPVQQPRRAIAEMLGIEDARHVLRALRGTAKRPDRGFSPTLRRLREGAVTT